MTTNATPLLLPPESIVELSTKTEAKNGGQATEAAKAPFSTLWMSPLPQPVLRFSPYAWAKLLYLRDAGPTEVGGFGISSDRDLFYVEDFALVKQVCTGASVKFDDESVADFVDRCVDEGLQLEQFLRIWIHTHPGSSPHPSGTDEHTFRSVFGSYDWAVMFILAQGGETYTRLRFNIGPGASTKVDSSVDYTRVFEGSDFSQWEEEYLDNVEEEFFLPPTKTVYQPKSGKKNRKDRDDGYIRQAPLVDGVGDYYGSSDGLVSWERIEKWERQRDSQESSRLHEMSDEELAAELDFEFGVQHES